MYKCTYLGRPSFGNKIKICTDNMYIYIQNKSNLYPFVDYSTFTVGENNLNCYYNCNSALEKEYSLINGPNHVIHYMNRVQKYPTVDLLPVHSPKKYSFQLLNSRSVRNKVDLITQLIIDSNCSISVITDTLLTIGDSALASQLTPGGFKVFLANKYILFIYLYIHHIVVAA